MHHQTFFHNLLQGGKEVVVMTQPGGASAAITVVNTFSTYNDVNATWITDTEVTQSLLLDKDMFVSIIPPRPFSLSELTHLSNFRLQGGSLFFMADVGPGITLEAINSVLSALGSSMKVEDASIDPLYHYATGKQVARDDLTIGVNSVPYAYTTKIDLGNTGRPLLYTTTGETFVAYEPHHHK